MTDKENWIKQRASNALRLAETETDPVVKDAYLVLCTGLQQQAIALEMARKGAVLTELGISLNV